MDFNKDNVQKIYLGNNLIYTIQEEEPIVPNARGKFTDNSSSSDWWYYKGGSNSSANKVDITEFVNPETKEFGFDLGNPTILDNLFYYNTKLERIDELPVDENVISMGSILSNCTSLKTIDVSDWNVENVNNMYSMFAYSYSLTEIQGIENWNVQDITNMDFLFAGCEALQTLNLSNWNIEKVSSLQSIFSGCSSLTEIQGIENWDVRRVLHFSNMFAYSGLNELDLSNWNTDSLQNTSSMFQGCTQLWSLNLTNLNVMNLFQSDYMFQGCSNLTDLYLCNWTFNQYINSTTDYMFYECYSLQNIYGPIYNINFDLDLSHSSNLSYDSMNVIIEGLYDFNEGMGDNGEYNHYLYLHPNAFSQIEYDWNLISLATVKGWSVVSQS